MSVDYVKINQGVVSQFNGATPADKLAGLTAFIENLKVHTHKIEPFFAGILVNVLTLCGDSDAKVREKGTEAIAAYVENSSINGMHPIVKAFTESVVNEAKWQTKVAAMEMINLAVKHSSVQLCFFMPDLVPQVSSLMWDTKNTVSKAAAKCMGVICTLVNNIDIEKFIPALINCIAKPSEVPQTVHQLSATTFVQQVTTPTLSVMVPLLVRALNERQTAIKRKAAIIIENMCKLVEDHSEAALFVPKLLPALNRVMNEEADPECRSVAASAHKTLMRAAGGKGNDIGSIQIKKTMNQDDLFKVLLSASGADKNVMTKHEIEMQYVASICAMLCEINNMKLDSFVEYTKPFLYFLSDIQFANLAKSFIEKYETIIHEEDNFGEAEEEGEDLCKCEFSLAYGGKILLTNTMLHLKRGHRYGLCGPNGCGKSTLMRSIANGQLENFPSPDELRTVYVEHDIDADTSDKNIVDFITQDPICKRVGHTKESVIAKLREVGFNDIALKQSVGSLSGGNKMKLALTRAMCMNADILLLDEPTNHMDVINVKWLVDYLNSLESVTCIIVSHDAKFLDNVCTNIIHYEYMKLKQYRGNLSEFVKKVPEAKSYYELESASMVFKFPEPGFLEGIKSKGRAILKLVDVAYCYPGRTEPTVHDINLQCSLSSRVAVIGPNGAGKSTMIKVLTGDAEPTAGTVWRHPNLRIAYVAQHAFHHLEQHLEKTPNEYLQWRYAGGEDREEMGKASRQFSEEEIKKMAEAVIIDGSKRVIDKVINRRKKKNSYEYEVTFVGFPDFNDNVWMSREELEVYGFTKSVNEIDAKKAAEAGILFRPITFAGIEQHFEDIGLEKEFASHSQMRGLSGGQKVKVVIAAAMWNHPHLLVLDEPTNYLDREALGALAGAIRTYGGGVIMISHNSQFTSSLCAETWAMTDGTLIASGNDWTSNKGEKIEKKDDEPDEIIDKFGNIIKIEKKKKLTGKEARDKKRKDAIRKKRGEILSDEE